LRRAAGAPKTKPTSAVTTPASGMVSQIGKWNASCSQAVAKAPTPKKAAWPMLIWPVKPTRMLRPSAAMPRMPMLIIRLSSHRPRTSGQRHSRARPTNSAMRELRVGKMVVSAA
jgi:hypothetical protein